MRVVLLLTGRLGTSVWVGRGVLVVGCLLKVVTLTCADDVNGFSWIGCVWFIASPGSGWRTAFSASIISPQRVILQSIREPAFWLVTLSQTTIDQSPTPSSPLVYVSQSPCVVDRKISYQCFTDMNVQLSYPSGLLSSLLGVAMCDTMPFGLTKLTDTSPRRSCCKFIVTVTCSTLARFAVLRSSALILM